MIGRGFLAIRSSARQKGHSSVASSLGSCPKRFGPSVPCSSIMTMMTHAGTIVHDDPTEQAPAARKAGWWFLDDASTDEHGRKDP